MSTISVIAVFVSNQDWMQLEYADHTRSKLRVITTGEAFVSLAQDLDSAGWLSLQQALLTQNQWVPVGKVVTIE